MNKENIIYDVIIIGAGPSGLSAAMYLKRANLNVIVIEKNTPGGKIITTGDIENYPGFRKNSGFELAKVMYQQVRELKIPFVFDEVIFIEPGEVFNIDTRKGRYYSKNVIIAVGTEHRTIGIPGEEKFLGNGISYCAICDGNFYKDENVVVVGGGNSAFEEGLYLTKICKSVTLLARSSHNKADAILVEKAKATSNMIVSYNKRVIEFIGTKYLEKCIYEDIVTKEIFELPIDGAFIYVGYEPNTSIFKHFGILDKDNFIVTNDEKETIIKGMYAIGDCIVKPLRQIVTASSDGAICAATIIKKASKE